jgi:membrane fusion protein (multidrug efflux system)
VQSISPATGATFSLIPPDNASGNFTKVVQRVPVRISIDPSSDPDHLLRQGLSVEVSIDTSNH